MSASHAGASPTPERSRLFWPEAPWCFAVTSPWLMAQQARSPWSPTLQRPTGTVGVPSGGDAARKKKVAGATHRVQLALPVAAIETAALVLLAHEGVTDTNERAMFLAQLAHESGGFRHVRENLHYRPARLLAVFPKYFRSIEDADAVAADGEMAIAERIYGMRKGLGNTLPGDGAKFIGRGFIQLTGRANYTVAGTFIGVDLVAHPELAERADIALRIAGWFWQTRGIGPLARAGNVRKVTQLINGGTVGLTDREKRYEHYRLQILNSPMAASLTPKG